MDEIDEGPRQVDDRSRKADEGRQDAGAHFSRMRRFTRALLVWYASHWVLLTKLQDKGVTWKPGRNRAFPCAPRGAQQERGTSVDVPSSEEVHHILRRVGDTDKSHPWPAVAWPTSARSSIPRCR
jgi:hypothetical protein